MIGLFPLHSPFLKIYREQVAAPGNIFRRMYAIAQSVLMRDATISVDRIP
jgi:hypothetical protein